jgi:hypothetical protein
MPSVSSNVIKNVIKNDRDKDLKDKIRGIVPGKGTMESNMFGK